MLIIIIIFFKNPFQFSSTDLLVAGADAEVRDMGYTLLGSGSVSKYRPGNGFLMLQGIAIAVFWAAAASTTPLLLRTH